MYRFASNPGMGMLVTIPPLQAGWTPATIDIFSDWGSALHVAYGALAAAAPFDWALILFALMAGYEATKAAGGESWQRIGGVWVEFALGMSTAFLAKRMEKGAQ